MRRIGAARRQARIVHACAGGALALLVVLIAACRADPPVVATPPVWSVTRGETTVYLFGSAHVLSPQTRWRSGALQAAFADAERLVFEAVPGPQMIEEAQALFDSNGRNPQGITLTALLGPSEAERLWRVTARLNMPMDGLQSMRPWLAAQQIALASATAHGARADHGVETQLLAQAGGRVVEALETPAEQILTLATLSPEDEVRMLGATLRQAEEDPQSALRAEQAWARGDLAAMEALGLQSLGEAGPTFYARVITTRNQRFAAAAAGYLAGADDVLFVVGAAHMVGQDGVIALLRGQGLTVSGP